jgi:hypothetical protein
MQGFGGGFFAPIVGASPYVLWHFAPIDTGEPLQFQNLESAIYLRTFRMF